MAVLVIALLFMLLLQLAGGRGSAETEQMDCCHEVDDLRQRLAIAEAKLEAVLNKLGVDQDLQQQPQNTGRSWPGGSATTERRWRHCPPLDAQPDPACIKIQKKTWTSSWAAVDELDQKRWEKLDCACQLRPRSGAEEPAATTGCPIGRPAGWEEAGRDAVRALKDKYRGEKCVLLANGPSLNRISWDWLPNFKVVMGMNKIYLGLERFNLTRHMNVYAVANPLVMQQSVQQIVAQLPLAAEKFVTVNNGSTSLYPCDSARRRIHFARSSFDRHFFTDISEEAPAVLCEGYTVTHYSLQVLYFLGCQTVYLVGLDHSFAQTGLPNEIQTLHGDDLNHFDKAYFGGGQQWHTADLRNSEHYYSVARQVYESDDRRIIDVTAGGKCTIFEKGDYREELYGGSRAHGSTSSPLRLAELTTPLLVDGGSRMVNLTVAIDADPWLPDATTYARLAAALREQAFAQRLRLGPARMDSVLHAAKMRLPWMRAAVAADDAEEVAAQAPSVVRTAARVLLLGPADGSCGAVCWAALFSRAQTLCNSSRSVAQPEVDSESEKRQIMVFAASDEVETHVISPEITTEASKLAGLGCNVSLNILGNDIHSSSSSRSDKNGGKSNLGAVSNVTAEFESWLACTHDTPTRTCPPLHLSWPDLKLEAVLRALEDNSMVDAVWLPSLPPEPRPRLREIVTAKFAVRPGGLVWIEHPLPHSVSPVPAPTPLRDVAALEISFTSLIYNAVSKQPGNGPLHNLTDIGATEHEHRHAAAGCLYHKRPMLKQQLLRLTSKDMEAMRCMGARSSQDGDDSGCGLVSLCTTQGPPSDAGNVSSLPSERTEIHTTATKAMARLTSSGVVARSTLLTESSEWAATVQQLSGGSITPVLLPEQGPPQLKTILQTAEASAPGLINGSVFACFMNGDIVLDSRRLDLTVLILQAAVQRGVVGPGVLVVARRTNVQVSRSAASSTTSSLNSEFEQMMATGSLMEDDSAMDIFLWTGKSLNSDPSGAVPEFVVGRVEWDKWVLGRAIKRGFSVVDATSLLSPIHLSGGDGNFASRRHDDSGSSSQQRNRALYAAAEGDGTIDPCVRIACAQFVLQSVEDGSSWALYKHQ